MRRHRDWAGIALLLTIVVSAPHAFPQATISFAQLNGTVLDSGGRTVAKAPVTARNVDTNTSFTATTTGSGFYVIPDLPPGHYDVSASYSGFSKTTQTGIVLTVGQTATVNLTLKVASLGETVVVTGEAPVIEPTKTEISQVIETQQIQALPISGRLFTDFALLTPSVAKSRTSLGTTFTEFEVTQISFGGMRSFSNEITVDGADFVNTISGVQRATPPQDSVQEFRVVNNSFGAEYGRALGGIVNIVTKSGTNDFHGSIYDYLQNSATDARSLLQPAPLPHALRQNQFGGTLGGPIRKDKTFFYLNYEGKRRGESPTYAPDLFGNIANIDKAKAYLGLSPEGCNLPPAQCPLSPTAYLQGVLKTVNNDYGFARLDHQINTNNRLAIRYIVEDARDTGELIGNTEDGGGIGSPSGARNLFIRDQSLVGTLNSVLKPNLVNTVLGQYARRHYNFPGATGEPDLSVVNDLEFGHNFGTYDAIYESRAQGSESLAWVKGNHVAKFGFDGNYAWSYNNYPGFTPERILFPNLDCVYAFADTVSLLTTGTYGTVPQNCPLSSQADGVAFMYWGIAVPRTGFVNGYQPAPATGGGFGTGWPNAFPTNMYSNYAYSLNHGYWGFFAQDQWRLTPKLTLNYGLRWDFESGLGNTINADYRAFQPRIGFAYSPDSKTVIRAGSGIFYDRNNMTFFFTTGNQKTLPGYFCSPPSADPGCAANGFSQGVVVPMIQKGAPSGGWQLSAAPGFPGTPSLPCPALGLPPALCSQLPGTPAQQTISIAALQALGILADGPKAYPPVSLTGPCTANPVTGAPTGACGVGSGGIQRNGRLPYAEQASLEVDRQMGGGLTLQVGYLFVGAHKLVRGNNLNVPCPYGTAKPSNPYYAQGILNPNGSLTPCSGTPILGPLGLGPFFNWLGPASPIPPSFPPPNPLLAVNPSGLEFGVPGAIGAPPTLSGGLLDYNNNVANAVYHGLTVTALQRIGKVFNLTANYTYSHTIDNGNFTTFINLPPNQFDYTSERGNSNQDVRHHFVANFTATGPARSFVRNFEFSSIVTLQSGRPFTLFSGQNTFGDVAGLSTDRVGGLGGVCTSVSNCSTTIGRNTYLGDPLYSVDLRVSRYFQISERVRLDLTVDAFNLFNRQNVDEVSSIYGSPAFCGASPVIPKRYNDATTLAIQRGNASVSCATQQAAAPPPAWLALGLVPVTVPGSPNPTFGQPRTMLNPRQLQFALKFSF
jgi:outer membrane receptor protein involved in Fe transport